MNEIRNILLIGRTGSGKSTLGNVLVNKNGNFTEVFEESPNGISKTENIQVEPFDVDLGNGKTITYRVIDVVGIGDTKMNKEQVLYRLADFVKEIKKDGINRILFTTTNRFNKAEADAYRLLSTLFFDEKVVDHITIVRTNFFGFRDKEKCKNDIKELIDSNQHFRFINDVPNKKLEDSIIHVNNSPPEVNETLSHRKYSREILLTHLALHKDSIYKTDAINDVGTRIEESIRREKELREKLEREVEELRKKLEKLRQDTINEGDRIKELREKINNETALIRAKITDLQKEQEELEKKNRKDIEEQKERIANEIKERRKELNDLREYQEKREKEILESERLAREEQEKKLRSEIGRVEKDLQDEKERNRLERGQIMAGHAHKKMSLGELMEKGTVMAKEAAGTGVELGIRSGIPIVGPAVGGLIGAGTAIATSAAAIML